MAKKRFLKKRNSKGTRRKIRKETEETRGMRHKRTRNH